jgi:hypothetical protein
MSDTTIKEALNKFFCRHAGESRHPENSLKPLDSGFRRNDENGLVYLFRASLSHINPTARPIPRNYSGALHLEVQKCVVRVLADPLVLLGRGREIRPATHRDIRACLGPEL